MNFFNPGEFKGVPLKREKFHFSQLVAANLEFGKYLRNGARVSAELTGDFARISFSRHFWQPS